MRCQDYIFKRVQIGFDDSMIVFLLSLQSWVIYNWSKYRGDQNYKEKVLTLEALGDLIQKKHR